jgi:hypothetical protein
MPLGCFWFSFALGTVFDGIMLAMATGKTISCHPGQAVLASVQSVFL